MIRTWQVEFAFVAIALASMVTVSGTWIELLGALCVLATFGHAQVADRLAEREQLRTHPEVECHGWARRYWVLKEAGWLVYFLILGCWSPLVGVGVFIAYPAWRSWYRRRWPVGRAA